MIRLVIEPRATKTWEAFCRESEPSSIALDGYVAGPPAFSEAGPHANFDHHYGVDRLATRSTSMQVFTAITMGLFDRFQRRGEPWAHVFVNDPDPDVCLAVWLLRHPEAVTGLELETELTHLLLIEEVLDVTAGAFPVIKEHPRVRRLSWVFEPYFESRMRGTLPGLDACGMASIIEEVGVRIGALAAGRAEERALDAAYDELGGGPGWRLITERGLHARAALFATGVRAFVSARARGDGTWTYSLGRMSPFVDFPLRDLYERLNEAEGVPAGSADRWGGSNTIGGSPRAAGSRLDPESVARIVNEALAAPAGRTDGS